MSDNKKWFKVWATILVDPHHSNMSVQAVGRWTRLGALMVSQGNNGRMQIIPPAKALCVLMECDNFDALLIALKSLPNVHIDPPHSDNNMGPHGPPLNDNGAITVSFTKWFKYQMDSTGYERVKRSRYKRREDKIRSKSTSFLTSPRATRSPLERGGATREITEHGGQDGTIRSKSIDQQVAERQRALRSGEIRSVVTDTTPHAGEILGRFGVVPKVPPKA